MKAERRSVRLAPLAEHDLEDIWGYTARTWSVNQADRYLAGITEALDALARGDRVGRDARDIRRDYLKYAIGRHVLFYKFSNAHIDVIRILHQSMDIESHLDE